MRLWLHTALRFVAGVYFILTSLYCLLAFLPYTYCALIKAPPYPWMPWFAQHQASLYWMAVVGMVLANWSFDGWKRKWPSFLVGVAILGMAGLYLTLRPFLPGLESDRVAYGWAIMALLFSMALSLWRSRPAEARGATEGPRDDDSRGFAYSMGLVVAVIISLVYTVATQAQIYREGHVRVAYAQNGQLAIWSLISHLAIAIAVLSTLNLIYLLSEKTRWPQKMRRTLIGGVAGVVLLVVLVRFLNNAMSFDGWAAYGYAGALALALALWVNSLLLPWLDRRNARGNERNPSSAVQVLTWGAIAVLVVLAFSSRMWIGGEDWNGFVASSWALTFWIAMSICFYRVRRARARYSATVVLTTLLGGVFVYKTLQFTEIFWAKPIGSTDDEISLKLEEYGERDASFQLAHHVLGNGRNQRCGDLCRILREYTNIRDTHIHQGIRLVDQLTPTQLERPDIFIFVIDSMRPDYIGAYNPQLVNYTPNLDALARDGVAFRNVYTEYAGTSISEPSVWSGGQLLHTHFPQPFNDVNSLRSLARADGYQLIASYDTVLQQLLSPSDDVVKLDVGKLWNQYEACSTVEQLESTLNARPENGAPALFFAQPMNVHQFARNDVPSPTSEHWQSPAGLNSRITYEVHWVDSCLGGFFRYLKQRGLYDNSVIIVTSDHGDATGEFGRISHSTSIWPEIMRVPLIVHLPARMRQHLVYDDRRISTLTDIAPTLYYLLGHRPIRQNPLYGRPLFAETKAELDQYPQKDLLLASDVRAVYGILTADGRYLYTTYDSPAASYLFDLAADPHAEHDILNPALKQRYDEEIIKHLQVIGDYYGYKPGVGSLLAAVQR